MGRLMTARPLELEQALKRRLLHLRQLTGTSTPATLDAGEVAAAERELGVQLGDPVLALLANRDDALVAHEVRLRNLAVHTRELHEAGGSAQLIGLGRDPEGAYVIGIPPAGGPLCFVDLETKEARELDLVAWLDELVAEEIAKLRDVETEEKARAFKVLSDEEVRAFAPALISDERPRRRVEHPKFGPGVVLRELEGGAKLEVRFEDGSTRTLLARFVRAADPSAAAAGEDAIEA